MKKLSLLVVLSHFAIFISAQKKDTIPDFSHGNYVISNLQEDTVTQRDRASSALRALRDGCVIVRLKTDMKSVEAYRKMGRNDIANRIEADRKERNQKLYFAFKNYFTFCPVFFIYANETSEFLKGNRKIFLNAALEHDPSITTDDTSFVFCEYGSAVSYTTTKHNDPSGGWDAGEYVYTHPHKILDTLPTQTVSPPVSTSALVFLDKNLQQFYRPFPYVDGVYLDDYKVSVRALDRQLLSAYSRLVINKDIRDSMKEERKKQREKMKQLRNDSNTGH